MEEPDFDSSEVQLLEVLVSEFSDRCRRGEQPSVDEYVARHPQLGAQLRNVLPAAHALARVVTTPPCRETPIPETIGDFVLLGELGRGGMGVVYRALQQSLGRTVALKVLPAGEVDATKRERFRREASIAARLHHTNIVPVFGSGVVGDLHYYAMQLIEGVSLDRLLGALRRLESAPTSRDRSAAPANLEDERANLAARKLLASRASTACGRNSREAASVEAAPRAVAPSGSSSLTLRATGYSARVAEIGLHAACALAHAHSQGVLHRDIKPSNLILDEHGATWVTDFGLARQEEHENLTSTRDVVGTVRYMAPERFRGVADARSDVYALGLTLYELLTLRPPFEGDDRQGLIRQVLESHVKPPSKLQSGVPRDLETIVMKAIAREPEGRYATAEALREDLQRFLEGRPVVARPVGWWGQTSRWARRNPVVATLAALLLVVLTTSLGVVTWQWRRAESSLRLAQRNEEEASRQRDLAERRLRQAREVVDDYLTTISESQLLDVPTLEPLRAALLGRARGFYESFLETRPEEPQLKAELAATYIRLSQVTHDLGGDWMPIFEQGLELLEGLGDEGAEFAEFRSWREGVYASRAGWLRAEQPEKALPLIARGVEIWQGLVEQHPQIDGFRSDLAALRLVRGMIHLAGSRSELALDDFEASRALRERLVAERPEVEKHACGLAESYAMMGIVHFQQDRLEDALRDTTRARDLFEALTRDDPSATKLAGVQGAVHQWIASIYLRQKRPVEALAEFRRSLALQERLAREYPYVTRFQTELAQSYQRLGRALFDAGQTALAEDTFEQCFAFLERQAANYPEEADYRSAFSQALVQYGRHLADARSYREADKSFRRAIAVLHADDEQDRAALAVAEYRLGRFLRYRRAYDEAAVHLGRAIEAHRTLKDGAASTLAVYYHYRGDALEKLTRLDEAAHAFEESLALRAAAGASPREQGAARLRAGAAQESRGRWAEAEEHYRQALAQLRAAATDDESTDLNEALQRLTGLLRRHSSTEEAERVLAEQRAFRAARFGAAFGEDWQLATFSPSPPGDGPGDRTWDVGFSSEALSRSAASAVDFRWIPGELPPEGVAIRAEGTLTLAPGTYALSLDAPGPARLFVDERLTIEQPAPAARPASGELSADAAPRRVRIEALVRGEAPRLRFWVRRAAE